MKLVFTFLIIAFSIRSYSQSRLLLYTNKKDAITILDTSHIKQREFLQIDKGKHILKIWAPKTKLIIDTLIVTKDTNIYLKRKLEYTEEYKDYKSKIRSFYLKRTVPVCLTMAYVVSAFVRHQSLEDKTDKALEEALMYKTMFEKSVSVHDINLYRLQYEDAKDTYNKNRKADNSLKLISAIVIPIGVLTTYYFYKSTTRPEYHETPQLVYFDFGFNDLDIKQPSATIKWKF